MREAVAIFAIKDANETRVFNTALNQYPVRFSRFHLGSFEQTQYEYNQEIRLIVEYIKKTYGCTRYVIEAYEKTFVLFATTPMRESEIEFVMFGVAVQLGIA